MSALHAIPAPLSSEILPGALIDHPSGYLALSPRNQRFSLPGVPGFIAYREQGGHLISMGGVHAKGASRAVILDAFIAEAERRRKRVVAVQIREDQADLFRARGFTVNPLGSTYGVRLSGFSLAGGRRMKLRHKIKQARAAGLRVLEVGVDIPRDEATFSELAAISAAWLREKRKKELDFMIGEVGTPGDAERRIFAVERASRLIGFITYVPVWGSRPGYLHDLTRRLPDAPPGAMELCNAHAMERLAASGAEYLHFGFTPFIVERGSGEAGAAGQAREPREPRPGSSRVLAWFVRMLGRYGAAIYPAQSQVSYKLKWGPDVIEPELIALRPLSLRAVLDLLLLTRSL
jgi:lysylphosphatidylglycerol synthetase-like protein (DUF2156 family)